MMFAFLYIALCGWGKRLYLFHKGFIGLGNRWICFPTLKNKERRHIRVQEIDRTCLFPNQRIGCKRLQVGGRNSTALLLQVGVHVKTSRVDQDGTLNGVGNVERVKI